jgi:hypothetical protein
VQAGVSERVAMMITGHRTREVFMRYQIVSPGDLREAAWKMAQTTLGHNPRHSPIQSPLTDHRPASDSCLMH